jgi:hypothetical protein
MKNMIRGKKCMEPSQETCKHEKIDPEKSICLICGADLLEEYDLSDFDDLVGDVGVFH